MERSLRGSEGSLSVWMLLSFVAILLLIVVYRLGCPRVRQPLWSEGFRGNYWKPPCRKGSSKKKTKRMMIVPSPEPVEDDLVQDPIVPSD